MKKMISMLLAATLSLGAVAMASGCQTKDNVVDDDKTINVRLYKAGFGDAFIYDLKKQFESVYAAEGYKMNVLTPTYGSAGTAMVQEMSRGYDETKIDLYITGAITPNQVSEIGEYGEVCEDLEQIVFNQTAIGYDGKESADKISKRIMSDFVPFLRADNGTMYGFNWAQTTAGMVVNTTKLAAYGVTELPRTTDELFEVFDMIYNGANGVAGSSTTKTYPVTYNLTSGAGGATTYQNCAIESWIAQYDIETYNEFLRMQTNNNGTWTDMTDGWKVFQNENIKKVMEVGYQFMDAKYSAYGSSTQTLDQAQGLIMQEANGQNNAIFMLNGDWFLNEVKANHGSKLANIEFMNVPVISDLGVKLFGAGTKYNLSDDACDDLLSYICKLVDENKSVDEIVSLVKSEKSIDLDKADAQAVATARGTCFSRGIEHLAFITKGCTKKDIAAKALRMMASDDFAETFMEKANASSPYTHNIKTTSQYKFVNSAKALAANVHFRAINSRIQGLRFKVLKSDYIFPGESNFALTLYNKASSTSYADAATNLYNSSIAKAQEAWNSYNK
ncbi:MAG: carbohydrate ABC transporter substrate-binding protein [Clostridia bacterium]|nr:carbohydrate ABC transporter substrate-binding protein [Clostridia bacterium]